LKDKELKIAGDLCTGKKRSERKIKDPHFSPRLCCDRGPN
jgi:hypothetical protein